MAKSSETHFLPFEADQALKALGQQMSRARRARGDTQKVAAERCGIHPQTIARIERGDPGVGVGHLFALMTMYGLSERLFDLAKIDDATEILYSKHLPARGRSSKIGKA